MYDEKNDMHDTPLNNEMHDCALISTYSYVERCIICTIGGEG